MCGRAADCEQPICGLTLQVVIAGPSGREDTEALLDAAEGVWAPDKVPMLLCSCFENDLHCSKELLGSAQDLFKQIPQLVPCPAVVIVLNRLMSSL